MLLLADLLVQREPLDLVILLAQLAAAILHAALLSSLAPLHREHPTPRLIVVVVLLGLDPGVIAQLRLQHFDFHVGPAWQQDAQLFALALNESATGKKEKKRHSLASSRGAPTTRARARNKKKKKKNVWHSRD